MLNKEEFERLSEYIETLKCTDPQAGSGLFGFVLGGETGDRRETYEQHLIKCEYCRVARELYRYRRDAAKIYNKWAIAKEIVGQAQSDGRILRRSLADGTTAYFRSADDASVGTTVVVDPEGNFQSVEQQRLHEFQDLK